MIIRHLPRVRPQILKGNNMMRLGKITNERHLGVAVLVKAFANLTVQFGFSTFLNVFFQPCKL